MKNFFAAVTLLALLASGSSDLQAQLYGPEYYDPYWDSIQYSQQYDPYYELHLIHYQLYRSSYSYQLYQSCCYFWGGPIPGGFTRFGPPPRSVIRSGSRAVVGVTPGAVGPLPAAVGKK